MKKFYVPLVAAMTATFLMLGTVLAFATVQTDQYLYNFGDTVQITGDEMAAGEAVSVDVNFPDSSPAQHHEVQADEAGNFSDSFYLAEGMPAGDYLVVATGQSSENVFTTTFDPGTVNFDIVNEVASPNPVTVGNQTTISGNLVQQGTTNPINVATIGGSVTVYNTVGCTGTVLSGATSVSTNKSGQFSTNYTPSASGPQYVKITFPDSQGVDGVDYKAKNSPRCFLLTVNPAPSNTPPTVSVIGVTDGASYEIGSVPTAMCHVVDAEDPPVVDFLATLSGTLTHGLGSQTASCSYTDGGGLTRSASATYSIVDTTPPTITFKSQLPDVGGGWNNSNVTVTWSCSDSGSGVVDGTVSVTVSAEGANLSATGTCTDHAGNTASDTRTGIKIDKTAPVVTVPDDKTVEATGSSGATVNFASEVSADDNIDGALIPTCAPTSGSTFPLGGTNVTCTATDLAGNTGSASFKITVQDKTAPVVTVPDDMTVEATGPSGAVVSFSASANDDVDGVLTPTCVAASGSTFGLGTTTVTCSATDKSNNTGSKTFKITVVDTTPPTISFVSRTLANGNGWNNGDVTVNWSCTDIVGVVSASVSVTVSTEGAGQTAQGTCKDTSGNEASDTQSGINIDLTAPTIANTGPTTSPNENGWYKADVVNEFEASDSLSGLSVDCLANFLANGSGKFIESMMTSGEGTAVHVISDSCTDVAGNSASGIDSANFNIDKTAPTISGAPDREPNANHWYKADVTVSFTCGDSLSTIASCSAPTTLGEGADQSVTGTAVDLAGNSASATVGGINIDKAAPTLSPSVSPNPVILGGTATVTSGASDALSGIDTESCGPLDTSSVGAKTVSCAATDKAGNSNTKSVEYQVNYTFAAFSSPVDNLPVMNIAKAGQAIPLKWRLTDANGNPVTNLTSVSVTVSSLSCAAGTTADNVEEYAAGASGLLNLGNGYYQFNWKTPASYASSCKTMKLSLGEGAVVHTALFQFKK